MAGRGQGRTKKKWKGKRHQIPVPYSTEKRWERKEREKREKEKEIVMEEQEAFNQVLRHNLPFASDPNAGPSQDSEKSNEGEGSNEDNSEQSNEDSDSSENVVYSSDGEAQEGAGFSTSSEEDSEEENPAPDPSSEEVRARHTVTDSQLYPGSQITLLQAVVLILQLFFKHNCTKRFLDDFLKLLAKLLPTGNKLPQSKRRLFTFIRKTTKYRPTVRKHYVCVKKKCMRYVGLNKSEKCKTCKENNTFESFYEFDFEQQIRHLLTERNCATKLKIPETNQELISDITSGSEYWRANEGRQPQDLTIILNTDGIKMSNSTKLSLWPVMFSISEIPAKLRERFIGILGFWCSRVKPKLNSFLKPFCIKMSTCYEKGVSWIHPITNQLINSKITAPLVVADAPARAEIQCILNFNGTFGCNVCEVETVRVKVKGKRAFRMFPFIKIKDLVLRTENRMLRQEDKRRNRNLEHFKGVKEKAVAAALPGADWSTIVTSEYMHGVLLGVTGTTLDAQFGKGAPRPLKLRFQVVNQELLKIKPPSTFPRRPRSLQERDSWKANEYLCWLLYYSVPILNKHFPERYAQHWMGLSYAIFLLLKEDITKEDIANAENLLENFVEQMEELYGKKPMTYNTHQLLHLSLGVERFGPLWATSAFIFEHYNGMINNSSHGTNFLKEEVLNNIILYQSYEILKNQIGFNHDESLKEDLLLGKPISQKNLFSSVHNKNFILENIDFKNAEFHSRGRIQQKIFTSLMHKNKTTNDYTVYIIFNNAIELFGRISFFFSVANDLQLVVEKLKIDRKNMFVHSKTEILIESVLPILQSEKKKFEIVKINEIKKINHVVEVGNFICKQPNSLNLTL